MLHSLLHEEMHRTVTPPSFQNLIDNLRTNISEQFTELNKKFDELSQHLKAIYLRNVQPSYHIYPIMPNLEGVNKRLCMFHSESDWNSISTLCIENLQCPYGHSFIALAGKAICAEPTYPFVTLSAVCNQCWYIL